MSFGTVLSVILAAAIAADTTPTLALPPAPQQVFGVRGSICPTPDLGGGKGIARDATKLSPVPDAQSSLIDSYVAAATRGSDTSSFVDKVEVPAVTQTSCAAALTKLAETKGCASDPLYLLGDGEVRQAWVCNGRLVYDIFYTINGGKLINIWALDPQVPIVVAPTSGG